MLAKDSESYEESPVKVINVNDVNRNFPCENLSRNVDAFHSNDNFTLEVDLETLENSKDLCHDKGKTKEKGTLPKGYQFLPEYLFNYDRIPPPLVSSSWLKLLNSDEESGEDCIPLSRLRNVLKKKERQKKLSVSTGDFDSNDLNALKQKFRERKKSVNEYSPIKRKRGRPKKQLIEKPISTENEVESEETEPFWNYESDTSNDAHHDAQDQTETYISSEKQDCPALTAAYYNEHDYSKPVENVVIYESKDKQEKKVKKRADNSIRNRDLKTSFPCLECGKSFSATSTLRCHQRIHNGTLLTCPECRKGFVSKYLLKCHMRIHNGDLFMCHKCGRGFTTAELLKVHSRAHTGDRPFVCNICGKSFPTSSNMLQHKKIHSSEKKFLCSQCGSSFVQKRCLDYHMLTHAEKKNICNVCGKLWARKSDLIEHMRVHTGVKPYCCNVCPQKFSQASSLKRHQLVHMDIKPIQCVTCNKTFKCQEYYKRHVRKHKKDDLCNYA